MGEDLGMPIALCFSSIRVLTQTLLSSPLPTSFLTTIGNCCGPLPLLFGGPVTGAFLWCWDNVAVEKHDRQLALQAKEAATQQTAPPSSAAARIASNVVDWFHTKLWKSMCRWRWHASTASGVSTVARIRSNTDDDLHAQAWKQMHSHKREPFRIRLSEPWQSKVRELRQWWSAKKPPNAMPRTGCQCHMEHRHAGLACGTRSRNWCCSVSRD